MVLYTTLAFSIVLSISCGTLIQLATNTVIYKGKVEYYKGVTQTDLVLRSEGWSVSPSVRPSVRLSVTTFLPLRATRQPKSETNGFSATLA